MRDVFLFSFHAVGPIVLILALGYFVRRVGPWKDDFYDALNKLCFHVFLPIQLFLSSYNIESIRSLNMRAITYIVCSIPAAIALGILVAFLITKDAGKRAALVQACYRSNLATLGLPIAAALGGAEAEGFASLMTGICVPLFNAFAVVILCCYNSGSGKLSLKDLGKRILTNPLIIGTTLGLLFPIFRGLLPAVDGVPVFTIKNQLPVLYSALTSVSRIASPLLLFLLGSALDLSAVRSLLPYITVGLLLRLIVCPILVIGTALLLRGPLQLTSIELCGIVAFTASPVATSSVLMVQELGGDEQLSAQHVVWSSVFSMLTVFLITFALRYFQFL